MESKELLDKMSGRWPAFYLENLPNFGAAMMASPEHTGCPVHGGSNGFRFFSDWAGTGGGICNTCGGKSNGIKLTAWAKDLDTKAAEALITEWLQTSSGEEVPAPLFEKKEVNYSLRKLRLDTVWRDSLPITEGTPAWAYLAARGLVPGGLTRGMIDPAHLRWHPMLPVKGDRMTAYPAIVMKVSLPNGEMGSIHRIYLRAKGGKAPIAVPKRLMAAAVPDLSGSAIRLATPGKVLGVAEGLETALAGHLLSCDGLPVWACVTGALMAALVVPKWVEVVHVLADLDLNRAGEKAATTLAARLKAEGKKVYVHYPTLPIPEGGKGVDWLDVLVDKSTKF